MIKVAKNAGYCFGVNQAVNKAYETAKESNDEVYTLGPLIHNSYVVDSLAKKGIKKIDSVDEIDVGTIIIRSHGVGKDVYEKINEKKLNLVDATCPYVKSIQNKVENYYNKGYTIIIVGDKAHPEVIGVNGWCENTAEIIYTKDEAENIETEKKLCIVAQTTIVENIFNEIVKIIENKYQDTAIFNTICSATSLRQEEARELSSEVDAMVIVGDYHSSNTKKLVSISKKNCKHVYHAQSGDEIDVKEMEKYETIGVTAGASTPTQLIKEVIRTMDNSTDKTVEKVEEKEQTMADFEKDLEKTMKQIKVGDIIEGEIIAVDSNEVFMNIGYKSDGVVKKADFLRDLYEDLTVKAAKGDKVKVMVTAMNDGTGNVSLSKLKVDELSALEEAEEKFKEGGTLKGKIIKVVKGGLIIDLGFTSAFMPASYYDTRFIKDFGEFLGNEIECRIVEFDKQKGRVIVSRKVLLEEAYKKRQAENKAKRDAALEKLALDEVVTGPIKNITNFGMFIDLGGIDGFVHISDVAWKRVGKIEDIYKVGDEVTAKVIELDKDNYKVKLSVKDTTKEPWAEFVENYSVGASIQAKIKNLSSFGAFAEIIPDVEGLIHISQLSHDRVEKVEDVVKSGDTVDVKIIGIDKDKRKVSLSMKELMDPPKRKIEKNKVAYKESENVTLGDMFGDILGLEKEDVTKVKENAKKTAKKAKDKAEDVTEDLKEKAEEASEKAKEVAKEAVEKAKDLAEDAKEKAEEITEKAKDKAGDAAEFVEEKAKEIKEDLREDKED